MPQFSRLEIQNFPLWEKLKSRHIPLGFDLEVTARCNNDCRHCYINLPPNDKVARQNELSLDEIDRIAGEAVQLGALWCLVTGGEPLLRHDFAEIYMILKRRGLLVSVFTNATLIGKEHVSLFREFPPRDIEVTVYGVTRETYEAISRRHGSFDKFIRGLNMLMDAGVPVRLKAVAIQANFSEQPRIAEFCRARTKDYYRFDPQIHLRFDRDSARNSEIMAERLLPEQIVSLERADNERMSALQKQCGEIFDADKSHFGCDHLFHCSAGIGSFSISCDGKFRLCSSLCAPGTVYDLRKGPLAEAWNEFLPQVREMRSTRQAFISTCRKCSIADICSWCPAHAYLEIGEMDGATPYFCSVAHARAEYLREGNEPGKY